MYRQRTQRKRHKKKELFKNVNEDKIRHYFELIAEHPLKIAEVKIKYDIISSNGLTQEFLNKGGFTTISKLELAKAEKRNNIEALEFEKLKYDTKLSRWQVKTFWWLFGFALFGGLYSLYDIVCKIIKLYLK